MTKRIMSHEPFKIDSVSASSEKVYQKPRLSKRLAKSQSILSPSTMSQKTITTLHSPSNTSRRGSKEIKPPKCQP